MITDPKPIVEVLCPTTKGYDRRDSFILHRTIAARGEYALIDPASREVEVSTPTPEG